MRLSVEFTPVEYRLKLFIGLTQVPHNFVVVPDQQRDDLTGLQGVTEDPVLLRAPDFRKPDLWADEIRTDSQRREEGVELRTLDP